MFEKILIANRGEIACRIIQTARKIGVKTVTVYSDTDATARHVRLADEAWHIGGAASADSYLRGDKILEVARDSGAQAIHPGYGFLSENAEFAEACKKQGIVFVGPSPESIRAMGLKDRAKKIMEDADVPVVPGYQGEMQDSDHLLQEAEKIGFPVLIKAVAGGGGKGMRLVERAQDFAEALKSCQREAKASFGNAHVLVEKFISSPRHVEVQVFGDSHGNAVHLFERDCSLQRRHQKVVEEAPAPGLKDSVRKALGEAAVKAIKALGYENAGTIEFIMDSKTQNFYFMEMNTRLQVEHPVTEMITGQDLVEWQLLIAAGGKLPLTQEELAVNGHSFEVRLYAEDPASDFLPQTGKVARFLVPEGARVDTGIEEGDRVSIHYDPMVAKLIVHGSDREEAIRKMTQALAATGIAGLKTNHEFLANIFRHPDFAAANLDTGFIQKHEAVLLPPDYGQPSVEDIALGAVYFLGGLNVPAASADPWDIRDNWRLNSVLKRSITLVGSNSHIEVIGECQGNSYSLTIEGQSYNVQLLGFDGETLSIAFGERKVTAALFGSQRDLFIFAGGRSISLHLYIHGSEDDEAGGEGRIIAPMPGKIINVFVSQGEAVDKDQPLLVMEAMKMEMTIRAGCDGIIDELSVAVNDQVEDGALLVSIKAEDAA